MVEKIMSVDTSIQIKRKDVYKDIYGDFKLKKTLLNISAVYGLFF